MFELSETKSESTVRVFFYAVYFYSTCTLARMHVNHRPIDICQVFILLLPSVDPLVSNKSLSFIDVANCLPSQLILGFLWFKSIVSCKNKEKLFTLQWVYYYSIDPYKNIQPINILKEKSNHTYPMLYFNIFLVFSYVSNIQLGGGLWDAIINC